MISFIVVFCLAFVSTNANSAGAPSSACSTLEPATASHGQASSDASPYSVSAESYIYDNDDTISITLDASGTQLKGILCQIRDTDDDPVGTWASGDDMNYFPMMCNTNDDSITHSNGNDKGTSVTHVWTPPGGDMGLLELVCTFVENNPGNYWVRVSDSTPLTYNSASFVHGNKLLALVFISVFQMLHKTLWF